MFRPAPNKIKALLGMQAKLACPAIPTYRNFKRPFSRILNVSDDRQAVREKLPQNEGNIRTVSVPDAIIGDDGKATNQRLS